MSRRRSTKVKYVCQEVDVRRGSEDLPLLSVSIHRGVIPRSEMTDRISRADDTSQYKRCLPNDIVLNRMRAFQGAIGISRTGGLVTPEYLVLRADHNVEPRYLSYLFKSSWFVSEMSSRVQGIGAIDQGNVRTPRIYWDRLGSIPLELPELGVQQATADFLDRETARIDGIVARREKLIGLLRERRVEMRRAAFAAMEDGTVPRLPWLPPIPVAWHVLPLRWVAECLDGRRVPLNSEQRSEIPGDIAYWGANGIVDRVGSYLFDEELVLLGEDGAPFLDREKDVAFFVEGRVWINNHIHVLRPAGVRPRYLMYYLNLVDYAAFITGTTRDKLTQEEMGRIPVPIPTETEQKRIEQRIEHEVSGVDALVKRIEEQVRSLGEHRQALITAAVVGNVDVSLPVA